MFFLRRSIFLVAIILLFRLHAQSGEPDMLHKAVESLRRQFGDSITVIQQTVVLLNEEKVRIASTSRSSWPTDSINILICRAGDTLKGYGILDVVRGKVQPFTYLVGINPGGDVRDIDVLAYREAYGGEVAHEKFRRQFRGKTSEDNFLPGRTVKNISGATISVHAITIGIRRVLTTFELVRRRL